MDEIDLSELIDAFKPLITVEQPGPSDIAGVYLAIQKLKGSEGAHQIDFAYLEFNDKSHLRPWQQGTFTVATGPLTDRAGRRNKALGLSGCAHPDRPL